MKNVLANITGIVCDGAKENCSLKLSTSSAEAVIASYMTCNDTIVP
ncbi:L-serine ammonia-lyase, iron-sulfur-dependent, subunit alpha [Natroniella acetigena]